MEVFMSELQDADIEGWARLQGLLAMVALPPIHTDHGRFRRRVIEIEVEPDSDRWVEIEGVAVEMHRIICWTGHNGSTQQWIYPRGAAIPRWRTPENFYPVRNRMAAP